MNEAIDRDAILARRALLISAAASALGCTMPGRGLAERMGRVPLPSWQVLLEGQPPFSVDARVPSPDREQLGDLGAKLEKAYGSLRAAHARLEALWIPAPEERALREAASIIEHVEMDIQSVRSACGDRLWATTAQVLRARAHEAFLRARVKLLGQAIVTLPNAPQSLMAGVCLSCAKDDAVVIRDVVTFAPGEATTSHRMPAFNEQGDPDAACGFHAPLRITVNGHADAAEDDPAGLSKARAEHVRMRLLGCGLAEDTVVVRALGDSIPIEPPGAAINRRVDFDVTGAR